MSALKRKAELDFFGLKSDQKQALADMAPVMAPALDRGLDQFYATVSRDASVAHFFSGEDHRAHAKSKQVEHWSRILEGSYSEEYFHAVRRIGEVHSEIGLEPRSYIGGYTSVASDLLIAAMHTGVEKRGLGSVKLDKAERNIDALVRAVFFDMQNAISIYLEESERRAVDSRNQVADAFEVEVGEVIANLVEASDSLERSSVMVDQAVVSTLSEAEIAATGAEEASTSVRSVASSAEQMQLSAGEIASQIATTTQTASDAVQRVGSATETMEQLSAVADEIGSVVGLIQDIAEQTNLLALNATIESARAGEAGKGFAVVASEVKALAGQTASATDQIAAQIQQVQTSTTSAAQAIADIRQTIVSVNEASVTINAAVEEQSVVIREIAHNTSEAARGNEDSARAAVNLEASVKQAGSTADRVNQSAQAVRGQMGLLNERVETFLKSARAQ